MLIMFIAFSQHPLLPPLLDADGRSVALKMDVSLLIFIHDGRGGRILKTWQEHPERVDVDLDAVAIIADISKMPERVREDEFLPRMRSSPVPVYILAGGQDLSDYVPIDPRRITVARLQSTSLKLVAKVGSLRELETLMAGAGIDP